MGKGKEESCFLCGHQAAVCHQGNRGAALLWPHGWGQHLGRADGRTPTGPPETELCPWPPWESAGLRMGWIWLGLLVVPWALCLTLIPFWEMEGARVTP